MFLETEDANWSGTGRLAELKPHFDHPLFGIEITEEWQKLPDRSAKRVRCDLPVMCHFRLGGPKGQTKRVLGRLMDISTTGCQVRLRTSIPVGIAVILQLSPPGNEGDIVLSGNVMRQAQSQGRITPDYGIRFLRFEDKAKSAIEEWLRTGLRPADGGETQAEQTA